MRNSCVDFALAERTLGGRVGNREGVYTPIAIERVRNRLKGKGLSELYCAKESGNR